MLALYSRGSVCLKCGVMIRYHSLLMDEKSFQYFHKLETAKDLLDCISSSIEQEDNVLAVGSKLHLEVLVPGVEEEGLHHLVLPEPKVCLAREAPGRGGVRPVRSHH